MPTGHDPVAADADGDQIVEIQSDDSGATAGGATEDKSAVSAPLKVTSPSLPSWVEKGHQPTRQGIAATSLHTLKEITGMARQPQIGVMTRSSGC